MAVQPPALAGDKVHHIDGFLHISTRLGDHLAHLARHVAGVLLLALAEQLCRFEQDFAALGRRREAPSFVGMRSGLHCCGNIVGAGALEPAYNLARIGGIRAFKGLAGSAPNPLAAN